MGDDVRERSRCEMRMALVFELNFERYYIGLLQFVTAAVTKGHRPRGLNNRN